MHRVTISVIISFTTIIVGLSIYVNGDSCTMVYAQLKTTATINLENGRENQTSKGIEIYDLANIDRNYTKLQGIQLGSDPLNIVSVSDGHIDSNFHVKIPYPNNPNRVLVEDASIHLKVESIETKPNGLKIYHGKGGFLGSKIGDIEFNEGTLVQNSCSEAQLILYVDLTDEYASYFVAVTNKAKNLTDEYQHAIVIKELGNSSNSTIAKITENYLPKFVAQFNEFNNTLTPTKYAKAKENLARSFNDEIKSYEHYKTYLLTNNSTENDISTDYLSSSLKYETSAFKEFYSAVRNK